MFFECKSRVLSNTKAEYFPKSEYFEKVEYFRKAEYFRKVEYFRCPCCGREVISDDHDCAICYKLKGHIKCRHATVAYIITHSPNEYHACPINTKNHNMLPDRENKLQPDI